MDDVRDKVELIIAGRAYGGWTDVEIDYGIDSIAHQFTLSLTERGEGGAQELPVDAGSECRVTIGGETVITGYIDAINASVDSQNHGITASGRSKAADLIDCSAIGTPSSWSNRKFEAIAADLVKPLGISIVARSDTGAPFAKFAVQTGESVFEALERMAKLRSLLLISTSAGAVEIVTPTPKGAAIRLVQGQHFKAITGRHDVSQRFSQYLIKGQSAGSDSVNGKAAAHVKASATDPAIERYRPLMIVAEDQANAASMSARAKWEATVRAAKAQGADVTLPTWRDPTGQLWQPMQRVRLVSQWVNIDADLLITNVSLRLSQDESTATLTLAYPDAYSQMPVPPEARRSKIKKAKPQ